MRNGLAADLAGWERGELRVDAVSERHPESEAAALVEMHAFVSYLVSEPVSQPGPAWETLAAQLPEREEERLALVAPARRRTLRIRSTIAAFLTGAVIVPAAAGAERSDPAVGAGHRVGPGVTEFFIVDEPDGAPPNEDALGTVAVVETVAVVVPVDEATSASPVPAEVVEGVASTPYAPDSVANAPAPDVLGVHDEVDIGEDADDEVAGAPIEATGEITGGPGRGHALGHDDTKVRGNSDEAPGQGSDGHDRASTGHGRGMTASQA